MLKFENYTRKAFYFGVSVWTSEFVRGTCEKNYDMVFKK